MTLDWRVDALTEDEKILRGALKCDVCGRPIDSHVRRPCIWCMEWFLGESIRQLWRILDPLLDRLFNSEPKVTLRVSISSPTTTP